MAEEANKSKDETPVYIFKEDANLSTLSKVLFSHNIDTHKVKKIVDAYTEAEKRKPFPNSLKALELLADVCKWAVAIETGAIFAVSGMLDEKYRQIVPFGSRVAFIVALVFFFASIIIALGMLLSFPATVQRLPPKAGEDIFHMGTFEGKAGWPIYTGMSWLCGTFIIGLVCFLFAFGWAFIFPIPKTA